MLVKLGNVWVNPNIVESIYSDSMESITSFDTVSRSYLATIGDKCDEFASIVNNAIGQSFGGDDETPKEA